MKPFYSPETHSLELHFSGIANRAIRPTLGIVDPENIVTMPERVTAYSGFDVLCHAIESYTALPYTERGPAPENPKLRPAYQVSLFFC